MFGFGNDAKKAVSSLLALQSIFGVKPDEQPKLPKQRMPLSRRAWRKKKVARKLARRMRKLNTRRGRTALHTRLGRQ